MKGAFTIMLCTFLCFNASPQSAKTYFSRHDYLINNYYKKPYNKTFLRSIIPEHDRSIDLSTLYHLLIDSTQTKFVAFFYQDNVIPGVSEITKEDHETGVVRHEVHESDTTYFLPEYYVYMVRGIKYEGQWHYQKHKIFYLGADSDKEAKEDFFEFLLNWNFFKKGTTEFNPDFWETELFAKVTDLTKDPAWEKNKLDWQCKHAQNIDYIGLPEIIAEERIAARNKEQEQFDSTAIATIFTPTFETMLTRETSDFVKYSFRAVVLIYPKDREMILTYALVTNAAGEKTNRAYVAFPLNGNVYEWSYFSRERVDDERSYRRHFSKFMQAISSWDYCYFSLDDQHFWQEYVLKENGGQYLYLNKVN